jgi:hypothetical protein
MADEEQKVEPAPKGAPRPPNKLHEWGAAVVLMLLLTGILYVFLNMLRSASL